LPQIRNRNEKRENSLLEEAIRGGRNEANNEREEKGNSDPGPAIPESAEEGQEADA
jgi:hypothetical protein